MILHRIAHVLLESIAFPGMVMMQGIRLLTLGMTGVKVRRDVVQGEKPIDADMVKSARLRTFLSFFPIVVCVVVGVWLGGAGMFGLLGPLGDRIEGFVHKTPVAVALLWVGVAFVAVALKGAVKSRYRQVALGFLVGAIIPGLAMLWYLGLL